MARYSQGVVSTVAIVFLILGCSALPLVAAPDSDANPSVPDYQRWVERYAKKNFAGNTITREPTELLLVVTAVTGEDENTDDDERKYLRSSPTTYGMELSIEGHASYFSHSSFGSKGGGGGEPMPAEDRSQLEELIAKLPSDGSRLPPADRRMLLQFKAANRVIARVYDRADAPDLVWEILRLSRCNVSSWVLEFKPQSQIDATSHQHGGFFCLSPDGQQLLSTSANGPLQFWEPITHEFLAEVRLPNGCGTGIAFSPDGTLAVNTNYGDCSVFDANTWQRIQALREPEKNRKRNGLFLPQFLNKGSYLLLHTSEPSLRIFDTKTWQQVDRLPQIPEGAVQYFPSPSGTQALVRSPTQGILLWDVIQRHLIAKLEADRPITRVAYSPDASQVAIVTAQKNLKGHGGSVPQIRVWQTSTGKLMHELRPMELDSCERVEGLAWSGDGRYVLVATHLQGFFSTRSINVFSAQSGRHRGSFVGCTSQIRGMDLLANLGQLAAGSIDGQIYLWDLRNGLKQIADLETSFSSKAKLLR